MRTGRAWVVVVAVVLAVAAALTWPVIAPKYWRLSDRWQARLHYPREVLEGQEGLPTEWGLSDTGFRSLKSTLHASDGATWLLTETPGGVTEALMLDNELRATSLRHIDMRQRWEPDCFVVGPGNEPAVYARRGSAVADLLGPGGKGALRDAVRGVLGRSWVQGVALAFDATRDTVVAVWPSTAVAPREGAHGASAACLEGATAGLAASSRVFHFEVGEVAMFSPPYGYPLHWGPRAVLTLDAQAGYWAGYGDTLFVSRDGGRKWLAERRFSDGLIRGVAPATRGRTWVVYSGRYTRERGVWLSAREPSGVWSDPVFVELPGGIRMAGPVLVLLTAGTRDLTVIYQSPGASPVRRCDIPVSELLD
jgi:hypothetical protein